MNTSSFSKLIRTFGYRSILFHYASEAGSQDDKWYQCRPDEIESPGDLAEDDDLGTIHKWRHALNPMRDKQYW